MSDKVFPEIPDYILLTDTQMLHVRATIDANIEARFEAESRLAIAEAKLARYEAALKKIIDHGSTVESGCMTWEEAVAEKALREIEKQ